MQTNKQKYWSAIALQNLLGLADPQRRQNLEGFYAQAHLSLLLLEIN